MEKLKLYSQAKSWEISNIYVDDGYSGRYIKNRPQYKQMLEDIDQWDGILVLKMDRIHRNSKNFMSMIDNLRAHDKGFISMTENLDTSTAMGRFVMDIIQRIAQLESEQTGERTYTAQRYKAKHTKSTYLGGGVSYGYKIDPRTQKYIPIPDQLKQVKEAFELFSVGHSMRYIAKFLDVDHTAISRWLRNPIYVGYLKWSDIIKKIDVEPIISPMLWNKVQRVKTEYSSKFKSKRYNKIYEPLIIKDKEIMELSKSQIKGIVGINKPKHEI